MNVSVIIPTHDRRRLLRRALDSVRAQSRPPEQVIVVDDGSRDGTAAMVRREYPDVELLRQPCRGVSAARNRGIEHATGDWIALLDSDDEWLPAKLERQLALLRQRPAERVCHTDEIWIRNGVRVNPGRRHAKRDGDIFRQCLRLCAMSPSSILLHRSVLEDVGLFDESLPACEDYDLWLRITSRYPVALVEEPLVRKYGGHADQLSRRHWGMDRFRVQALQKILAAGVLDGGQRDAAQRTLRRKLQILAAGAAKRGKHAAARRYLAAVPSAPRPEVDGGVAG